MGIKKEEEGRRPSLLADDGTFSRVLEEKEVFTISSIVMNVRSGFAACIEGACRLVVLQLAKASMHLSAARPLPLHPFVFPARCWLTQLHRKCCVQRVPQVTMTFFVGIFASSAPRYLEARRRPESDTTAHLCPQIPDKQVKETSKKRTVYVDTQHARRVHEMSHGLLVEHGELKEGIGGRFCNLRGRHFAPISKRRS